MRVMERNRKVYKVTLENDDQKSGAVNNTEIKREGGEKEKERREQQDEFM